MGWILFIIAVIVLYFVWDTKSDLEKEKERLDRKVSDLEKSKKKIEDNAMAADCRCRDYEKQIYDYKATAANNTYLIKKTDAENSRLKKVNATIESRLEKMSNTLSEKSESIKQLKAQFAEEVKGYKDALKTLKSENDKIEKDYNSLNKNNKKLLDEKQQLEESVKNGQNGIAELQRQIKELKSNEPENNVVLDSTDLNSSQQYESVTKKAFRKIQIEKNTIYVFKLQHIDNPTFENVQRLARTFINDLPQPMVDEIYEDLNRGVDQLATEPQMLVYLHAFGSMHQAKLRYAFDQLPDSFREQSKVNIIDYGCGQAIGTMCYADFLRENGIEQNISTITLIEPSEICLRRAALHAKAFFPDAEIRTVCKGFDDLSADDILCDESTPNLHILSNVLDILYFDLERFANLINGLLWGYNQFVCVGPYFNYSDKDNRIPQFAEQLNGNVSFSKHFEKGELKSDKTWTAQIVCFAVRELEEELSTKVTDDENEYIINKGYLYTDVSVIYCKDNKRLLCCIDKDIVTYEIEKGTKVICNGAFYNCNSLQQITIPDSVTSIGCDAFNGCNCLNYIIISKECAERFKGMLPKEMWDKLYYWEKDVNDNKLKTFKYQELYELPF